MSHTIYIAEDDKAMAGLLSELAREAGFVVQLFHDGAAALKAIVASPPDALLADIQMPGLNGLDLIERVSSSFPGLPAVVITGFATVPDVQRAFRAGAIDLITKPFNNDDVRQVLSRILNQLNRDFRMEALQNRLARLENHDVVSQFKSPVMHELMSMIDRIADLDTPILLTGETGTGKGVVARAIHDISQRNQSPWFAVNCGAVAESVAESELFGHERGAFTGADSRKRGVLELASAGTLFLDEINSAPWPIQTRLLDFVQHKILRRVGGQESIKVDTRLIIASNQNLYELVKQGVFREDLWYRLNVFPLQIPPLRERKEDIIALAEHFICNLSRQLKRPVVSLTDDSEHLLLNCSWPGNVRQLENAMHRAVLLAEDDCILPRHLPAECTQGAVVENHVPWDADASLQAVEQLWIQHMLERCDGNKSEAARRLGIDVSTLHRKLKS